MKALLTTLALCTVSINAAYADQIVSQKNGMPCVDGLCLGDSTNELSTINFDTAKAFISDKNPVSTYKLNQTEIKMMSDNYKGNIAPIISNLKFSLFDNKTILGLSGVTAVCNTGGYMEGNFTSKGGNPTRVRISLLPTEDTSKQAWVVTHIVRQFPAAKTADQRKEIKTEMDSRYSEFAKGMRSNGKPLYLYNQGYGTSPDTLTLILTPLTGIQDKLVQHPLCGGKEKVKFD